MPKQQASNANLTNLFGELLLQLFLSGYCDNTFLLLPAACLFNSLQSLFLQCRFKGPLLSSHFLRSALLFF
jgi:hypothetical protein